MPPLNARLLAYGALAAAIAVLGARQLRATPAEVEAVTASPPRSAAAAAPGVEQPSGDLVVHVAGAVRRPGLYELAPGARVGDAIEVAGGAARRADLDLVNLAAKLEDGRQVVVPARAHDLGGAEGALAGTTAAQPIDLNQATPEQLQELDGIGPALAGRIVEHREQHGGFTSVDELAEVPGIGEKRLAALRDAVRV